MRTFSLFQLCDRGWLRVWDFTDDTHSNLVDASISADRNQFASHQLDLAAAPCPRQLVDRRNVDHPPTTIAGHLNVETLWRRNSLQDTAKTRRCDDPVGVGVIRAPYLAHAATAQQLDKAITPERRALHRLTIRSQPLHRRANRLLRLLLPGGHRRRTSATAPRLAGSSRVDWRHTEHCAHGPTASPTP